jgi:hypothetical protein
MSCDTVTLKYRVGPGGPDADGSEVLYPRTDRFHSLRIAPAAAEYEEMVSRGEVYCASNQSVVTFGTALTATAVTFTLYNPAGSPVDLVLLQCGVTILTAGTGGHLVYAANVNNSAAAPATNTSLSVRNAKLDLAAGYAQAYSATTLPAAPVAIRTLASAITAAGVFNIMDDLKGAIVIGPNTAVTVQGITIVGTGLISMFWRERKRLPS